MHKIQCHFQTKHIKALNAASPVTIYVETLNALFKTALLCKSFSKFVRSDLYLASDWRDRFDEMMRLVSVRKLVTFAA
jgi:hypothetical protein